MTKCYHFNLKQEWLEEYNNNNGYLMIRFSLPPRTKLRRASSRHVLDIVWHHIAVISRVRLDGWYYTLSVLLSPSHVINISSWRCFMRQISRRGWTLWSFFLIKPLTDESRTKIRHVLFRQQMRIMGETPRTKNGGGVGEAHIGCPGNSRRYCDVLMRSATWFIAKKGKTKEFVWRVLSTRS